MSGPDVLEGEMRSAMSHKARAAISLRPEATPPMTG